MNKNKKEDIPEVCIHWYIHITYMMRERRSPEHGKLSLESLKERYTTHHAFWTKIDVKHRCWFVICLMFSLQTSFYNSGTKLYLVYV